MSERVGLSVCVRSTTEDGSGVTFTWEPATADDIAAHLLADGRERLAWEVVERVAPKLAGPWIEDGGRFGLELQRHRCSTRHDCAAAFEDGDGALWAFDDDWELMEAPDVDTARREADAALTAAGYRLVPGDDE
jgi:hypothetical protein